MRERQVATAEDALASREARVQQEIDQKVGVIRGAYVDEYRWKLGLQETRFQPRQVELQGKTDTLRVKLAAAERREKAAEEAWASSQAELSSLQQ